MFQEHIAELTASHLRSHIKVYLQELEASFTGSNKLSLKVPGISSTSLVGGVIQAEVEALPIIGVDCLDKEVIPSNESLNYYQYEGAIAGMVAASDETSADKAVKRYQRVVERFIREHLYLHGEKNDNYLMREFQYTNTRFSGAIEMELEESQPLWAAGFTINCLWITSEDAESQH